MSEKAYAKRSNMQLLCAFHFVGLIVLSVELPAIQLEYKSVISEEGTVVEIVMNGVSLTPSDDRINAFDLMRPSSGSSAILRDALRISANRFNNTDDHTTYQRCRKCRFSGYQLIHVSDQIMRNGQRLLSLDERTDTWTALDPQAFFLKEKLDRDHENIVQERVRFQEACTELLKEHRHSQSAPRVSAPVLTPLLAALVLLVLVLLGIIISKHGVKGSAQPAGGVLGSIIHYPASDIVREPVKQPSHSIKASLLSNMP